MRDGQSIDEMMQRIRAEARKDDAPAEDSAGERKPGDAPRIEPLSQALERLRRQSHPQQKQQPLAPAGGQVITPYARPGEVSKPRITPLQAENARTVTGVPYENAGTFTHLQYEVEVAVDSRDLVGKLNPRNAGLANLAAQSAKKFVQRSLSWYTRSLHHFQKAVAQALVHIQTLLKRHDESLASQQREMTAMREELEALRAEVRELRDRQRHGAGS
jgi:polyhydroxyalkanoate synthesis regulator phasin